MRKYDLSEDCTIWFVLFDDGNVKRIHGYSDDKELVDAYMEFHHCKHMSVKKVTNRADQMFELLNENINDEIGIYNRKIRKKKNTYEMIMVPMTYAESVLVNDEVTSMMYTRIDYQFINEVMYYLKDKYQKAIKQILLKSVINKVVYNRPDKVISSIDLDEVALLVKSQPDMFG